ncbi:MAG: glycosyltransferase family 2 protein, partial [Clostridia bacterium]|nr:glycosyltransferase family 2 protein [Clostridia bacterium]
MKFSLCIPMYNEVSIIEETAKTLSAYMSEHFDDYEILFANDGSTDNSAEMVEKLALPNVRVVGYEKNRGKGAAVRTAVLCSVGDVVMFTDADLAYGTEVISRVAKAFEENPDVDAVIGSRNISKDGYEGYTLVRKLASKAYIKLLCFAGGLKL